MLPLSAFDPAAINAEVDAVSRCHDFGSSVPLGLLHSNNATTFCSTASQQDIVVADTVNAVGRCCANVEHAERELVQPKARPGGLVFRAGGLPRRPLPPSLFPSRCPPPFAQFRAFSTQVLAFVLPTCWMQHSQHALTYPSSPLLLIRVCLRACLLSSLRVPRYTHRRCTNFAWLPRETISLCWVASPPVDAIGRLALSASTDSRINRRHEGPLISARTHCQHAE